MRQKTTRLKKTGLPKEIFKSSFRQRKLAEKSRLMRKLMADIAQVEKAKTLVESIDSLNRKIWNLVYENKKEKISCELAERKVRQFFEERRAVEIALRSLKVINKEHLVNGDAKAKTVIEQMITKTERKLAHFDAFVETARVGIAAARKKRED